MSARIGLALLALAGCAAAPEEPPAPKKQDDGRVIVPGTSLAIRMLPLPGTSVRMSATEIPWEAYDAFVFRLDQQDPKLPRGADAVARPSQPYITMDRAFGHAGYPVISVSLLGAQSFCGWLTEKTGRTFRVPTEAEWQLAAGASPPEGGVRETKTHPVGSREPNALGFHDLLGNAAEWCSAPDGSGVLRGGSYLDADDAERFARRQPADKAWNKSDPQIPKSRWWLADGGFIGFRIVAVGR